MAFWPTIGNLAGDAFSQTGAGQDINGFYNMYNKAAGNPASQLIGQPGGIARAFGGTPSPNASLGKGDFDPTLTQGTNLRDPSAAIKAYKANQAAQNQTSLQPIDNGIIGQLATQGNSPMQYMGQVQSKEGLLGGLLKQAAMAAVA